MANICSFEMHLKGSKKGIEKFIDALTQSNYDCLMGRGAEITDRYEDDGETIIHGCCKWSIQSALIDDALSMRKQQQGKGGLWGDIDEVESFITLFEACEEYSVNMEVYSEECGVGFQEHYKYENGEITDECVDYEEIYDEDYEIVETRGGFDEWSFDLKEVA